MKIPRENLLMSCPMCGNRSAGAFLCRECRDLTSSHRIGAPDLGIANDVFRSIRQDLVTDVARDMRRAIDEAAGFKSATASAMSSLDSVYQEIEQATRATNPIVDLAIPQELKQSKLIANPISDLVQEQWGSVADMGVNAATRLAAETVDLDRSRELLSSMRANSIGSPMKFLDGLPQIAPILAEMQDVFRFQETVRKSLEPSLETTIGNWAGRLSREVAALGTVQVTSFVQDATRAIRSLNLPEYWEDVDGASLPVNQDEVDSLFDEIEGLGIEKLPDHVQNQSHRRKQKILAWILLQVLSLILFQIPGNLAAHYIVRFLEDNRSDEKAAARLARQHADLKAKGLLEAGIPARDLVRWRVVTVPALNVQSKPARHSQKIGEIHLGDIVIVHRTRCRSWTLIEWMDGDGELGVRGWVFTRYLQKLNFPKYVPNGDRPLANYNLGAEGH